MLEIAQLKESFSKLSSVGSQTEAAVSTKPRSYATAVRAHLNREGHRRRRQAPEPRRAAQAQANLSSAATSSGQLAVPAPAVTKAVVDGARRLWGTHPGCLYSTEWNDGMEWPRGWSKVGVN